MRDEAARIMRHLRPDDRVWLLERSGTKSRARSSRAASTRLRRTRHRAGDLRRSPARTAPMRRCIERAEFQWSLSQLTFLHEWARMIVLEQLYRAAKIARMNPTTTKALGPAPRRTSRTAPCRRVLWRTMDRADDRDPVVRTVAIARCRRIRSRQRPTSRSRRRAARRVRRHCDQRRVLARKGRAPLAATRSQPHSSNDAARSRAAVSDTVAQSTPTAGFINLRLAPHDLAARAARDRAAGRRRTLGAARERHARISLEFGSANPTGPLVVVQGRTLSIGDTLANAMRFCGYDVFTEWIINDAGAQIETLGRSLYARYRQTRGPGVPVPRRRLSRRVSDPDRAGASYDRDGDAGRTRRNRSGSRTSQTSAATRSSPSSSGPPRASASTSISGRARKNCTTPGRSPKASSAYASAA